MNNTYLDQVVRRGNDLNMLEQAAVCFPERSGVMRWVIATALGLIFTLLPSVTAAQACLYMY